MTNEELDRLEELERAATPGPWLTWIEQDPEFGTNIGMVDDADSPNTIFHPSETDFNDDTSTANVKLIASLRNAAPALLAAARENARLRAVVEAARKVREAFSEDIEQTCRFVGIERKYAELGKLVATLSALDAKGNA